MSARVVILGCGFGGLWAAQGLRKGTMTLIDEARGARRAVVQAHPLDAVELLQRLTTNGLELQSIEIRGDDALARGELRLHTDVGTIDARLAPVSRGERRYVYYLAVDLGLKKDRTAAAIVHRHGEQIILTPPHCDPTVNLYESYHVVKGDTLVEIWPVTGRGRSR